MFKIKSMERISAYFAAAVPPGPPPMMATFRTSQYFSADITEETQIGPVKSMPIGVRELSTEGDLF